MKSLNEILKMKPKEAGEYLYNYAYNNGRLEPKWERLLLPLGDLSCLQIYAETVIKGRWPEAEGIIIKDPEWAYRYAKYVIKGKWPEAEDIIKKDPIWAYFYARWIIEGRWPEAEDIIKKSPRYACWYAEDVIKGRWLEAEEYIKKDKVEWQSYCYLFGVNH